VSGFVGTKVVMRDGEREASMLELYRNNISVCAQKVRIVPAEKMP
jgi:hypothetical protein